MALSIPLVAIFMNSAVGKAWGESIRSRNRDTGGDADRVARLETRVRELEATLQDQQETIGKLEENHRFLSRLLEDSTSTHR
jgi:predicted RNase H-like nuclease (RuvC/YqgF family)